MRLHFVSRLALLMGGSFLVIASQEGIWAGNALKWMFVVGGALAILASAADSILDSIGQRALDFFTAVVGAWMIVEVLTLHQGDIKWWSFGSAAALAGLSVIGLVIHEWSTERVVHELRVTHHQEARRQAETSSTLSA